MKALGIARRVFTLLLSGAKFLPFACPLLRDVRGQLSMSCRRRRAAGDAARLDEFFLNPPICDRQSLLERNGRFPPQRFVQSRIVTVPAPHTLRLVKLVMLT